MKKSGVRALRGLVPVEYRLGPAYQDSWVLWSDLLPPRPHPLGDRRPILRSTLIQEARKKGRVVTELNALCHLDDLFPEVQLSGLIFHVSRCGSTLLCNMLGGLEEIVVLNEPPQASALLWAVPFGHKEQRVAWLRGAVHAMCQYDTPTQKHAVIKFPTWDLFYAPLIREAFPEVPILLLIRDPVEVVASCLLRPRGWVLRESNTVRIRAGLEGWGSSVDALSKITEQELLAMSLEEYCARYQGALLRMISDLAQAPYLLVNYDDLLVDAVLRRILDFMGIGVTEKQLATMHDISHVDAKRGGTFEADSEAKRSALSAGMRGIVEEWTMVPYRRLEALRLSNPSR